MADDQGEELAPPAELQEGPGPEVETLTGETEPHRGAPELAGEGEGGQSSAPSSVDVAEGFSDQLLGELAGEGTSEQRGIPPHEG